MYRKIPQATPALAKAVWERQKSPSSRSVARAMTQSGYSVHFTTVDRWRKQGWRNVTSVHPLDRARASLGSALPLVTEDPTIVIGEFIERRMDITSDADSILKRSDSELIRQTARQTMIAASLVACDLREGAENYVATQPAETGALLASLAEAIRAAAAAMIQARNLEVENN